MKKSTNSTQQLPIYQNLIDHIRTPAWIMTEQADIVATNPAWKSLIGGHAAISFWDYLASEQRSVVENRWATGLSNHEIWSVAFELVGLKYQIWQTQFEPLAEDETQGPLWLATAEPIDCRIQPATQSFSKNSEFVRQVLESNRDCIKVIDLEGALLYMNQGGQLVMEIDDFALVKQAPWLSFWSGGHYDAAKSAFYQARSGRSARFEGFCPTAKGTPRWWDVWVTPMFDAAGNVAQVLSVSRDITERKQAEQALAKQNQELEQFTYAVSHDLKSPLRGISNLAHWLEDDLAEVLPEESRQHLQLIRQRIRRMNALVEGLLDLSRIGRKQFHVESVDVSQLLREVVDLLAPPDTFTIEIPSDLPHLVTQKILLTQVLANLISNAIKHHGGESGKIQITAQSEDKLWRFTIADDGPGIAKEYQEKIFGIFQTLDEGHSSENTGIGLTLTKKIVTEMGGEIWVENLVPRGCQFCFTWAR